MTVKELIELLQSYPQDMIVVDDLGILEPRDIHIEHEYPLGDSANPKCEFLDEVLYIE